MGSANRRKVLKRFDNSYMSKNISFARGQVELIMILMFTLADEVSRQKGFQMEVQIIFWILTKMITLKMFSVPIFFVL